MKINNLSVKIFLDKLEIVGNAISNNQDKEYLKDVKIVAKNGAIMLLTYDNISAIKTFLLKDADDYFEIEEEGNIIVDFMILKNLFSKLNCDNVSLKTDETKLIVKSDNGIYKLSLDDYNIYPEIKFEKFENNIKFKVSDLRDIISKTIFAVATNEAKLSLTGVYFELKNNILEAVSTDSYRLSKYKLEVENDKNDNFLFTKKSLIILDKLLSKSTKDDIIFSYNSTTKEVTIGIDKILYKSRLMLELYPDIKRIITNKYTYEVKINRKKMLESIDRMNIFSDDMKSSVVLFAINKNVLSISNMRNNFENAKETIPCISNYDLDNELKVLCSSSYLIEALKCFDCEEVIIKINEPLYPFIICQENSDKIIELLLPLKNTN